jgi:poly(A) polymerase
MLLGIESTDYDIATDATPDQVHALFRRVLLVGAKFGVAMVIHRRQRVEVTTFRSDVSYSDGRRPDSVEFSSPKEDALRRDFTINGMFYDPVTDQVIDYVGGREDLVRRVVRTIGDPGERFGEDYLRMIRAVRFAVRLDFAIEPATAAAVRQMAEHITAISGERIFEELSKMLSRPSAAVAMERLRELGLAERILPELFAPPAVQERVASGSGTGVPPVGSHETDAPPLRSSISSSRVQSEETHGRDAHATEETHGQDAHATAGVAAPALWPAALARLGEAAKHRQLLLALSALLCELPHKQIVAIVRRWGASNDIRDALVWVSLHLCDWRQADSMSLADLKRLMACRHFGMLRRLWRLHEKMATGRAANSAKILRRVRQIPAKDVAPAPLVTGEDVMALGLSQGPRLGECLRAVYDAQLNGQIKTRQEALALAERLIGKR